MLGSKLGLIFFIGSEDIFHLVTDTSIIPGYRTDHSGISLKFKLQNTDRGKGYWKFNNSLLRDENYIKAVKDTLQEQKYIYTNNNGNNDENAEFNMNNQFTINYQLFLETLLFSIRGETIKYSSRKKKESLQEEKKLEEEIKNLEEFLNDNLMTIDNNTI